MDEKQTKSRLKGFEQELEMKIMHRVEQKKMIEYQKSMAHNVLPKTDRLYQRMLKKDEEEIQKLEGKLFLNHYRMGYGVKQDLYYQGLLSNCEKDCEINESESDYSGIQTQQAARE